MKRQLKILLVEDNPADVELVQQLLRRNGFDIQWKIAQRKNEFEDGIFNFKPDFIFSDHNLPSFSGLDALKIAGDESPDTPFIFITGALGDENAAKTIINGATDFILKDSLNRLPDAIIRAKRIMKEKKERKKAEEKLKELNAQLEFRIKERTKQLEEANLELQAFNYTVSHDLRTPLRAAEIYAQLLTEKFTGKLPATGKEYLKSLTDSINHMKELISNLLAFSLMGKKEKKAREVNFKELFQTALEHVQSGAILNKIDWKIHDMPTSVADPNMIQHVVVNLLSNAIKFSQYHPQPVIEIGGYTEKNEVVYYVKDNGVGFDMKHKNQLFKVFNRLHSSEQFEGTGAGLAIVERILLRHGGRVWAESEKDKGATFYFTLPLPER